MDSHSNTRYQDNASEAAEGSELFSKRISVHAQYISDLSFEMPDPLAALAKGVQDLHTQVHVEVAGKPLEKNATNLSLEQDSFEVVLRIKAHVKSQDKSVYLIELDYAGIFSIQAADPDWVKFILFIECPSLLFPFARSIVSRITQESGLPPLFLKPIDFAALLQKRLSDAAESGELPEGFAEAASLLEEDGEEDAESSLSSQKSWLH